AAREFLRLPDAASELSLGAPPDVAPTHFRVFRDGVEVPPEELPMQRAARDSVMVQDLEFDIVFADGMVKRELISARPLRDEHGNSRGAVASIMDITAREAIQKE